MFIAKIRLVVFILAIGFIVSWNRFSINVSAFDHTGPNELPEPIPVVKTSLLVSDAKDVLQKVNLERRKKGLSVLVWEDKLSSMALKYSKQMADEKFFSHFDPEGLSIVDRAKKAEIMDWSKIGENLFHSERLASPAKIAVEGWKESKTHRDNILDPVWTHTGVGVYKTKDGHTYITQVFLQRQSK